MKLELRAFHAGDGDCLLLSAENNESNARGATAPTDPIHILIDGGRSGPFTRYTAPYLYDPDNVSQLDLVVVSHIDNDHISGILRILKDKVKRTVWQVKHDSGRTAGMPRKPPVQPPQINKIWHNPVEDHFGDEQVAVSAGASIATSAAMLGGSRTAMLRQSEAASQAATLDNLATGVRSAVELQARAAGRLGLTSESQILDEDAPTEAICTDYAPFKITVIGPCKRRMEDLAEEWHKWVEANEAQRQKLMERLKADEEQMGEISASALSPDGIALGGSSHITVPNLASLMMMVECDSRTILLTGDGSAEDILDGLEITGFVDSESAIHLDVLKVPHHGAEANVSDELCERVTADHYVFCGNGAHTNPEIEVLRQIVNSRVAEVDDGECAPFTFWFTTDSATDGLSESRKGHMEAVEAEMAVLAESAPVSAVFLDVNSAEQTSGQGAHLLIDLSTGTD